MEYDNYESDLYKPSKEASKWGMWCHLGGLALFTSIPFAHLIVPIVIWMTKRGDDPFIDECGKEAVNFQVTITLYLIASILLSLIVIGIPLLLLVLGMGLVCPIKAAIKASDGEHYRYPFTLRLFD